MCHTTCILLRKIGSIFLCSLLRRHFFLSFTRFSLFCLPSLFRGLLAIISLRITWDVGATPPRMKKSRRLRGDTSSKHAEENLRYPRPRWYLSTQRETAG